ncbi:MAG TPA: PAS domain S-box protein [Bacteroidales bacterium]|nr:PAS domain S-box protein [Bacteroidales bacterium]HPO64999.1 PAS domain S-box protein [Bacteroidales bacterium]
MEKTLSILSVLDKSCCNDVIFIIFDQKYKIIYISPIAVRQQLALSADALVGKELSNLLDPLDASTFTSKLSFDTFEPQQIDYLELRCADGTNMAYSAYFQKFRYEATQKELMLAIFKNKLQSSSMPEQKNTLIVSAINHSEEAIAIVNDNAYIVFANNAFLRWHGLTETELKVLRFYEIDSSINNADKWEIHKSNLQKDLHKTFEMSFVTAAGTSIDVEQRWRYHIEGNEGLYVCYMIPIKERKETEKKIHKTLERQHILSQIAFILNTHENFEYKVNEALRLLGNFMQVDRILIFQNILSNKATSCTFEWHSDDFIARRFELQAIPYSLLPELYHELNNNQHVVYEGISNIPTELVPYFRPYDIHALMAIPFKFDTHSSAGFMCIVDHKQRHNWKESDKRFIRTFTDILTSTFRQKQNIDLLLKSERRFRELAELLPEMVCEAAINGKIIFANKHTQVQFGFTENDLSKGIIFFNLFHPNDRQRVLDNFEKLLSGEHINNEEYTIINREKQEIPVLLYMNIIMQDQLPIGLRAVIVDISERKIREKHLENLANKINSAPFAILEVDKSGKVTYINEKAQQMKLLLNEHLPTITRHAQTAFDAKDKLSHTLILNGCAYHCVYNFNPHTANIDLYVIG